jgi:hypothetical protein
MEKMKFEGKQSYKSSQTAENRGKFRRLNNNPQILPIDPRSRDRDDHKIQTPLQNNLIAYEEGEEEELDPEIHCLGDTSPFPHLTQSTYEESLMDNQINELSKGEETNSSPHRYISGLRRKKGSLTSLISLPEQRSLLKMQQTTTRRRKLKTTHQ